MTEAPGPARRRESVAPTRSGAVAVLAGGAVLVTTVLAVVGLVVMDARLGGLGYAVFAVPIGVVAVALGALGWALLRVPGVGPVRTALGVLLALAAVAVLALIAFAGLTSQASTGA